MRRSIYRLSKVAEEGAKGRSGVQRDAQDDEADEGIFLTLRFLQAKNAGKRESNSAMRLAHSELRADKLCGCGERR